MFKIILVAYVSFAVLGAGKSNPFEQLSTTTEQSEQFEPLPADYYKVNNIPQVAKDCLINFECKQKLKNAETPKPCVKYCVKSIECGKKKLHGKRDQCLELNEEIVTYDYNNDCKNSTTVDIMPVAMIDFPCQPGYLPDSRGRCREVW